VCDYVAVKFSANDDIASRHLREHQSPAAKHYKVVGQIDIPLNSAMNINRFGTFDLTFNHQRFAEYGLFMLVYTTVGLCRESSSEMRG
jgi:hypothetical protein